MGFSSKEEKSRRVVRVVKTVFFLITMLISLLLFSAPVLLVIADTLLPSAILSAAASSPLPSSSSSPLETLSFHFRNYDFRYSLIDIPLISVLRSIIIICKLPTPKKNKKISNFSKIFCFSESKFFHFFLKVFMGFATGRGCREGRIWG